VWIRVHSWFPSASSRFKCSTSSSVPRPVRGVAGR
jgi:hypothetical protein